MRNRIYEVDKKVVNGIYYVHFAGRFRIGAHARLTDLHFSLASLFGIYSWSKYRVTVNKRNKGNHFFSVPPKKDLLIAQFVIVLHPKS